MSVCNLCPSLLPPSLLPFPSLPFPSLLFSSLLFPLSSPLLLPSLPFPLSPPLSSLHFSLPKQMWRSGGARLLQNDYSSGKYDDDNADDEDDDADFDFTSAMATGGDSRPPMHFSTTTPAASAKHATAATATNMTNMAATSRTGQGRTEGKRSSVPDFTQALMQARIEKERLEQLQTQLEDEYDEVVADNELKQHRIADLEVAHFAPLLPFLSFSPPTPSSFSSTSFSRQTTLCKIHIHTHTHVCLCVCIC